MELVTLFYIIDEFCKGYERKWQKLLKANLLSSGKPTHSHASRLKMAEILTIAVNFHLSGYRMFKWYYTKEVLGKTYTHSCFPKAVSYNQFLELIRANLIPLVHLLIFLMNGSEKTGTYFIDSTSLVVCSNHRTSQHKTFKGIATMGKTSEGWFFGFKLHIVTNDKGELMAAKVTTGNVADSNMEVVGMLARNLEGKLFADRGYVSGKLFDLLWEKGLKLVTDIKKNMKNKLMPLIDKLLLRKRFIIETINDHLKNNEQIEHSRHRSLSGFMTNLISGLIAYQVQPKKPSLHLREKLGIERVVY